MIRYFVKGTIQDRAQSLVHVDKPVWIIMWLLDQCADGDLALIKDELFVLGLFHGTRYLDSYRKSICHKAEQGFH